MAEWKKVIVSGSAAELSSLTLDTGLANTELANDGITIAGVDTSLGGTITAATIGNAIGAFSASAQVTGIGTTQISNDAVTNAKLANITRGSVKVGGTSNAPTDLDAKTSGQILVGDGTDVNSVAVSGDVALAANGAVTIQSNAVEGSMLNSNVAGSGLDYGSDELSVDVSDFMTNGSNNRIVTATGTDAMNAEANLTFDGTSLTLTGGITASSDISSSGNMLAREIILTKATPIRIGEQGGSGNFEIDNGTIEGKLNSISINANNINLKGANIIGETLNDTIRLKGHVTASGNISSSGTITANAFVGDGSGLTGIAADSFDFDGLAAVTSLNQSDVFGVSVGGTEKKITYSNLEDDIFGNLGGDVSVAAGGSVSVNSVQANSVALGTDTTGDYVATVADAGAGAGIVIGGATGEGQAATVKLDINDLSAAAVNVANDSIAIVDADGGNASKKESIADLATAMAGTGITATNGVFTTNDSEIDHDSLSNFSADEHFTQANITTVGTVTSGDVSAILPSGTVSGSAQVTVAASQVTEISNLTAAEGAQLENINSVTISNTQWGYLGASNQSIASGASPTFSTANFTDASNKRLLTDAQETLVDNAIQPNDNATLSDLIVTGDLTVQGDVTELQTTNLNIEDQFILLHSGSATNTSDSGIIFGGSGGTAQQGKAILWDSSYNSNDGRLAVSTTDVASDNTTNFGAGTAGYYVAGVFEGSAANAATAKADHNGNIRIESNEIYIYA